jgi:hypothetical protein
MKTGQAQTQEVKDFGAGAWLDGLNIRRIGEIGEIEEIGEIGGRLRKLSRKMTIM